MVSEDEIIKLVENYFTENNVKLETVGQFTECLDLFRRPVIGHMVYKTNTFGHVFNTPILMSDERDDSDLALCQLDDETEVLSILPAQPGTFAVYGAVPDSINLDGFSEKYLGLEFNGCKAIDWVKELKDLWIRKLTKHY